VTPIIAAPSCVFQARPTGGPPQDADSPTTDTRISVLQQLSRTQVSDEEIALIVQLLQQPNLQRRVDERRFPEGITPSRHASPSNADPAQVQEQLSDENSTGPNMMDPTAPANDPDFLAAPVKRAPQRPTNFLPAQRSIFPDHNTYRSPLCLNSNCFSATYLHEFSE
jgi:hypothetical protein